MNSSAGRAEELSDVVLTQFRRLSFAALAIANGGGGHYREPVDPAPRQWLWSPASASAGFPIDGEADRLFPLPFQLCPEDAAGIGTGENLFRP